MRFLEEVKLFQGAVEVGAGFGPGITGVVLFDVGVGVAEIPVAMVRQRLREGNAGVVMLGLD